MSSFIPLMAEYLFPLFSNVICLFVWFGCLGQLHREEREREIKKGKVGCKNKETRYQQIDLVRDKASAVPCPPKKGVW